LQTWAGSDLQWLQQLQQAETGALLALDIN